MTPTATTRATGRAAAAGRHRSARPFLKWAGGKGRLLEQLRPLFPDRIDGYLEPFVGGAAVFFDLAARRRPARSILADGNAELIGCYQAVRDAVEAVIEHLAEHARRHDRDHYYQVRALPPENMEPAERTARLIYLNRTCFNGLYRVNRRGAFNVPIGRYDKPRILDADNLRHVHRALAGVDLRHAGFETTPEFCRRGDFVYLDPPYQPLSATASFTAYTAGAFGEEDQRQLAALYTRLDRAGCRLMLSNSDTRFIRDLYSGYRIHRVQAVRAINSRADRRGPVSEVVVCNY